MMPPAAIRLGQVSAEYERMAVEYGDVAHAAAQAEADHKHARAKAVMRHKAEQERMSQAEAETRAEADDNISNLYRLRLVTAAAADSHRERLRQLKEQVAVGRSFVASERAADQIHATGGNT